MRYVRWVTENFWWKVLALAIAVVVWAVVASEPELSTFVTAPLAFKNLSDDLEVAADPVNVVTLELRGASGELRSLSEPGGLRPVVTLDMTGLQPGERTFAIGPRAVRLPRGVRLVRAIPSEARFVFDLRRARFVPVTPRFTAPAPGYTIAQSSVTPQQLQVSGPEKRVSAIKSVNTDQIDLSAVVGTAEFRVNAFVEDPYVRFISPAQVTVSVTMKRQ